MWTEHMLVIWKTASELRVRFSASKTGLSTPPPTPPPTPPSVVFHTGCSKAVTLLQCFVVCASVVA